MRSALVVSALTVVASCSTPANGPAPQQQPPEVPIAAASAAPRLEPVEPQASAAPTASSVADDKPWIDGKRVVTRGRVSNTPWQHMIGHVPGKQPEYFDLEDGGQTVIYTPAPISCPGLVQVEGKVKEVRGAPKRPSGPRTKVDDSYAELHVDVDSHRCL